MSAAISQGNVIVTISASDTVMITFDEYMVIVYQDGNDIVASDGTNSFEFKDVINEQPTCPLSK